MKASVPIGGLRVSRVYTYSYVGMYFTRFNKEFSLALGT
jgi:hypothetical protein